MCRVQHFYWSEFYELRRQRNTLKVFNISNNNKAKKQRVINPPRTYPQKNE